jgi:dihydroorotate dehydrogenase electron transfer subunit
MSILGTENGVLEILFKTVGAGTHLLSRCTLGDRLSAIGPIGTPFSPDPKADWIIAIGGGTGIPPLLFLLEKLANSITGQRLVFFGGSEIPFPFETPNRRSPFPGVGKMASRALGRLDRIGVPSALASRSGLPGTYPGYVTDLFNHWLTHAKITEQDHCQVFSCGPRPLMMAVQEIAGRNGFDGALCLEENMACAVGGCAGCVVPIREPSGLTMRRVCVDGPVFPIDRVLLGKGS